MDVTQQMFSGLTLNADLIRAVEKVLQAWSMIENAEILEAYAANGLTGGFSDNQFMVDQIAAIERDEPAPIDVDLSSYTVKGRSYTLDYKAKPKTVGDLANWLEATEPDSVAVELHVARPAAVTVSLNGGARGGFVTAETGRGNAFYAAKDFVSKASPEPVLDALADALANFVQPSDSDPRGNRVFLGHGHGSDWRILEDKLKAAGFEPQAFEGSAGAGDVNIYVVDSVIRASFAAVLYMTPDDTIEGGVKRARQNVIHEIGYAQGALGIKNVVIVQSDEAEMPTNIEGVNVVRFKQGALYEKLDEVVRHVQKIKSAPAGGH